MTKTILYYFDGYQFHYKVHYGSDDIAEFIMQRFVQEKHCTKDAKAAIKDLIDFDVMQIDDELKCLFEKWLEEQHKDYAEKAFNEWRGRKGLIEND